MLSAEIINRVTGLLHSCLRAIDEDRWEEWPEHFVDDCVYKVMALENVNRNLPLPIIQYENKNMLRDRIMALRKANVYNLHYDRHFVSNADVSAGANGDYRLQANFVVFQTDVEGETKLFSTGKYDATVVFIDDEPKFKEKLVIVDTFAVPNLISTPL